MKFHRRVVLLVAAFMVALGSSQSFSQTGAFIGQDTVSRPITTAVPFLSISPDARAAGMGDVGVATTADVNSIYWNPAKLVFAEAKIGASLSFTPWLRKLVNDMSLSYLSAYYKLDNRQAFGFALRYFNLGSIQFTDNQGGIIRDFVPNELAATLTYSRKLSEKLGVAVSGRYIHSNLSADLILANQQETKAGNTAAADIAVYYKTDLTVSGMESNLAFGANISNIGAKISYTNKNERDFIPTNLRLGSAFTMNIDEFNKFTLALDLNKLMVPTPPQVDSQGNIISGTSPRDKTLLSGMFGSFADAPGGFSEELKEFIIATGIEYWYNDLFAARVGYYNEHAQKGDRKYFTVGVGLRYKKLGFDAAYLLPQKETNPLAETLRFSILFNLGGDDKK